MIKKLKVMENSTQETHACGPCPLDIKSSTIAVSNIPTIAGNQLLLSTSRLQIADVMVHYRKVDRDFQIICISFTVSMYLPQL